MYFGNIYVCNVIYFPNNEDMSLIHAGWMAGIPNLDTQNAKYMKATARSMNQSSAQAFCTLKSFVNWLDVMKK